MATEKEDPKEYITKDDLIEVMSGFAERVQKSTNDQINGVLKNKINPLTDGFTQLNSKLDAIADLSEKVNSTESRLSEIFTALQAPDDDDPAPQSQPQAIDIEAMTAKIKAEIQEANTKQYSSQIDELRKAVDEARAEKEAIAKKQIESDRDNTFLSALKKVAPELNLFPDHEDVVMSKLAKDQVLQVSEDGTSWMVKTKRQDPYTKQVEDVVVPASPDVLKSIISESYAYYQQPRGGVGSNAAPTQSYSPTNRKITESTSAADLQQGFAKNDDAMLNEIATMIAQGA